MKNNFEKSTMGTVERAGRITFTDLNQNMMVSMEDRRKVSYLKER